MNTPTKVASFAVGLAAVFAVALGVGNAVGDVTNDPPKHDAAHDAGDNAADEAGHEDGHEEADAVPAVGVGADIPGGLMVSQDGYTLKLATPQAAAGKDVSVAFTIGGPDGQPVTAYDIEHEKQLHLIAVRRDFTGFQHVHPVLGSDGTWTTDLDLTPGQWRIFADFKATGAEALTLGTDLAVSGSYQPATQAAETRTSKVGPYTVTLAGDLEAGTDSELTLSVSRDGRPVTDLQPYLGAYGHLVALRVGDLAYLHVHPDGRPGDGSTEPGPDVVFYAAVPSAGTYNLYLDFQHKGQVRTASFTLLAPESASEGSATPPEQTPTETPDGETDDGHSSH